MKALQGTWSFEALEVDGQERAAATLEGSHIILKGDTFRTVSPGGAYEGTFTVDAARTPHTIDISFTQGPHAGLKSLGIFTLAGDVWTLCLGLAGYGRPEDFVTRPGSGHALETLRRSRVGKTASPRRKATPDVKAVPESVSPGPWDPSILEHGGEWSMVSVHRDGQSMVPEAYVRFGKRVVEGNRVTVTVGGQVMLDATFTVDPRTSPRSIDYTLRNGQVQRGIYELDSRGDDGTLVARFCMAPGGGERPAVFETQPGDQRTLSVWKR